MFNLLQRLRKENKATVALIGGSDYVKISEQLGGEAATKHYDYLFSENGLVSYRDGVLFHSKSIVDQVGEQGLQRFINFTLSELSKIELPLKRGTFIEFRNGMMNVSPIGRNCSAAERNAFEKYDLEKGVRRDLVATLEREFGDSLGLSFAVGGQISFDVFPRGWDKRYCLRFVTNLCEGHDSAVNEHFDTIHFFGDKTSPGGNDYAIFTDPRVIGHSVTGPEQTQQLLMDLFFSSS